MRRRTAILLFGLAVWLGLMAWYVTGKVADRRFAAELRRAEREMGQGRYAEARATLAMLAARRPGRGDVELHLGACEILDGNVDAALAAWGRVPDFAPEAAQAALSRGRIAYDNGRYSLAEACLERTARAGGEIADEALKQLSRLYWTSGRRDEHERILRRVAERERDPSEVLRRIWNSQDQAFPLDAMRSEVAGALRASPDDDRVWLTAADLATREGRFDEAAEWLARCERARPDDPVVWRARLEWAQAADRPDDARRAAAHLPVSDVPRARVARLIAWLAARRGDGEGERKALEESAALNRRDTSALERLADLATQAGDTKRVAELRRRKAAIDAVLARYNTLTGQPDIASHAEELARAAEALERWFDASLWWELAARRDPSLRSEADAARVRLAEFRESARPAARTLADLLPGPDSAGASASVASEGLVVPRFEDEARSLGLNFRFDNGFSEARQLPETMSGGVALLDFDGDGWLDVYAIQGGAFPPTTAQSAFGDRLFRNVAGRFEDVTASSGLAAMPGGYGHGVAVGDYDNDGRPDLLVTRWRSYALYHNLGGRFEDATARAGLGGDRDWPTSAAWADLDGDGDLDLYVCHYLAVNTEHPPVCGGPLAKGRSYCDPREFPALPDHVFRNDGGRFVDITKEAGIVDKDGRGLGVVANDLDGDGRVDLFVANDTTANFFFRNLGGFKFSDEATTAGLATSSVGGYMAGMGVACGDLDGDGLIDLAVTNFYGESTTLYHNLGRGLFADRTSAAGLSGTDEVRARLRPGRSRCQQRRPSRPRPGQRPRQRPPSLDTVRHAGEVAPGRRRGAVRRRDRSGRSCLEHPASRSRAGGRGRG